MKEKILTVSLAVCTVAAAVFGIAVAKEQLASVLPISDSIFNTLLIAGLTLSVLGVGGVIFSYLITPASKVRGLVSRSEKYEREFARPADLDQLRSFYQESFREEVPTVELMHSWIKKCSTAFSVIYRVDELSLRKKQRVLVGSYKILPITVDAVAALDAGLVSGSTFLPTHIAGKNETVAAYYVGDVVADKGIPRGIVLRHITEDCRKAIRKDLPVYARPLTDDGLRVMTQHGFVLASDGRTPPAVGKICKMTPDPVARTSRRRSR